MRAEEHEEDRPGQHRGKERDHQHRNVSRADLPADQVKTLGAKHTGSCPFRHRGERPLGEQWHVAAAHDVQVDRIERGHHQDPREQLIDAETRVDHSSRGARDRSCEAGDPRRQNRMDLCDQQGGRDRGTESDGAVDGDVRELEHAKAHENAEGKEREDRPDRERADHQRHVRPGAFVPRTPLHASAS